MARIIGREGSAALSSEMNQMRCVSPIWLPSGHLLYMPMIVTNGVFVVQNTFGCVIVRRGASIAEKTVLLAKPMNGINAPQRPDCVAGHVRFELRNVEANYPFERSHRFAGIQPNSGFGDYSRLSCGVGDTQLGRRPGSRQGCLRGRHQPSSRALPGSEPNSGHSISILQSASSAIPSMRNADIGSSAHRRTGRAAL